MHLNPQKCQNICITFQCSVHIYVLIYRNKSNYETGKKKLSIWNIRRGKKYIFFITVAIIRFDLGLFSDRSIKKKNNPAIKGMEYDRDTELLDVFVEEEVEALIENKQKKRVIHTHTERKRKEREKESFF